MTQFDVDAHCKRLVSRIDALQNSGGAKRERRSKGLRSNSVVNPGLKGATELKEAILE